MERDFMKKDNIEEIFRRFSVEDPEPKGELNYHSNYTLLVAVVLSAQATDISVNKATAGLFKAANSPQKLLQLGEEGLIEYIKSIGLTPNIHKGAADLFDLLSGSPLASQRRDEIDPKRTSAETLEQLAKQLERSS